MNVPYALVSGCMLALAGCASGTPPVDIWADATLIAEQAAVIAEQRRTLDGLEQAVGAIRGNLEDARGNLDRAVREAQDLGAQWSAIDIFVRAIIEAERRLEELQHADRRAHDGAGP